MSPITLYTTRRTPAGRAVEITAKLIGVELDVKFIDLSKKEHLTEEFLKVGERLLRSLRVQVINRVPFLVEPSTYSADDRR